MMLMMHIQVVDIKKFIATNLLNTRIEEQHRTINISSTYNNNYKQEKRTKDKKLCEQTIITNYNYITSLYIILYIKI